MNKSTLSKPEVIISIVSLALSVLAITYTALNYNLAVSQLSRDQMVYDSDVQFPVGRLPVMSYSPIGNFQSVTVNFALTFSPVHANSSSFNLSSDVWQGNLLEGNISSWAVFRGNGSAISYLGTARTMPVAANIIFVDFFSIKCSANDCPSSAHLQVWLFLKHA